MDSDTNSVYNLFQYLKTIPITNCNVDSMRDVDTLLEITKIQNLVKLSRLKTQKNVFFNLYI